MARDKTRLLIILPTRSRGGVEAHGLTIGQAAIGADKAASPAWSVEVAFPPLLETQGLIKDFEAIGATYRPLAIGETEVGAAATLSELIKTLPLRLLAWTEKPWHFVQVLIFLMRWRWQEKSPTVVLIELPWADKGLTSLLACALLNQPAAVVFHLIPWRLEIPRWKRWLYRWMRDRQQTWIAISDNNRQLVSESFHCPIEQIIRIYNGSSTLKTITANKATLRKNLRDELGLARDSILLLTVARLNPQKDHNSLVPTIPYLVRQFPKLHFVWVGSGAEKAHLMSQLNRYSVRSFVSFLGYRQDILALLTAADLFIFPTHFEGFPFALLEAMACALPVIATDVNGIPEIVEHGTHGLLVREGDSCDWLETLRWALTHPKKMQEMGDRAAIKVRDFSEQTMTDETLALLKKIGQ